MYQWSWNISPNIKKTQHIFPLEILHPQDAPHDAAHTQQADREHYSWPYVTRRPGFFLTVEPVSSKLFTHVFMAWADGTLLFRWIPNVWGGNVAIVVLIKLFYGKSTLCTSPRLHFKLNAIHSHATWQHHSPFPLKLKIEKHCCQNARFTGGPCITNLLVCDIPRNKAPRTGPRHIWRTYRLYAFFGREKNTDGSGGLLKILLASVCYGDSRVAKHLLQPHLVFQPIWGWGDLGSKQNISFYIYVTLISECYMKCILQHSFNN